MSAKVARRVQASTSVSSDAVRLMRICPAADAPKLSKAQDTWYRLSALEERFRGTLRLAAERHKHLSAQTEQHEQGRDPDTLDAEAEEAAEQEVELQEEVQQARDTLSGIVQRRSDLENRLQEAENEHMAAVRAIADRREGAARDRKNGV